MPQFKLTFAPLVLALATSPAFAAPDSQAEEEVRTRSPSWSAQFESGIATTYVWRGLRQYNTTRSGSSQTTATLNVSELGPGVLSASIWNATSLNYEADGPSALEVDVSASYSMNLSDAVSASLGYISFLLPETEPMDTHALSLGFSFNLPLQPSFVTVMNLSDAWVSYTALSIGHTLAPRDDLSFNVGIQSGLQASSTEAFHVQHVSSVVSSTYNINDAAYVRGEFHTDFNLKSAAMGGPTSRAFDERMTVWGLVAIGFQISSS